MPWPIGTRSLGVYLVLILSVLGVAGWQWGEHQRFRKNAREALINRGRDITTTLGIVVSSQRRFGNLIAKDRIESALQGLIHEGELESIGIVSATGETIASAGRPVELTPEMISGRGVYWRERELTLMNLMDLGPPGNVATNTDEPPRPAAVVVSNRLTKAFRTATNRPGRGDARNAEGDAATPAAAPGSQRFLYSRPPWMDKEEYDDLIKKQGVHSLVISLATDQMVHSVRSDLLLRSLVSLMALGAGLVSAFAWRNFSRNAELQIRLVKAGEMNSHLAQMNFAAAGLAHETRNPLNLIRGLAQMISLDPQVSPKMKEHASGIIEEADRVTVQLNEFIDFSKPREAHLAPVNVMLLVADVGRTLLPDIEDKHIQLQPPATPLIVEADEQLFRQALFNLLLNAVQSVAPGGRIDVTWTSTRPGEAALEIRDDGPGVPAADRTNIFKPYVTMRPNGVGLGLAIVQQIVAAHRWEITCEANEPTGAVFRISHLHVAAGQ